jgi:cyanophycin synthetase
VKIVATEVFCGPNVHAKLPLVRLHLDLGPRATHAPASLGERFREKLLELVPGIEPAALDAECRSRGAEGCAAALLVAEIVLELQRGLGAEVRYRSLARGSAPSACRVDYELWDEAVAVPAAQLALDALSDLIEAARAPGVIEWDAAEQRERMLQRLRPESLDLITMAMVREAVKRGIPWYRLVARKPFVQLGQGCRQKHVRESATADTSSTARYLSKDKNATSLLLGRVGLPVPQQRLVNTVEEALDAAAALGFPVVTKPLDRGNGKGVSVGLEHADAVRWGYGEARRYGDQVIVERFLSGEDHRILVIDGKMIGAAKRIPGHVVGDGEHTVEALVTRANEDPRRGNEYDKLMVRLEFDAQAEQVLSHAGLQRDSVPARGQVVPLRRTANVSTGGTCVDVTESVHPDNREAAIRATRVLGLNIAGVDFLTTDITRSYREIGGGICEVNFSPGLRPHWNANPSRDVVGPIVATMFPPGAPAKIPLAAVMGEHAPAACRVLARLLAADGSIAGSATRAGVEIGGHRVAAGNFANEAGVRALLFDPLVALAALECEPRTIVGRGLAVRELDMLIVLGMGDGAGAGPAERLCAAQVLIEVTSGMVVLDAEDPQCAQLVELARGRQVGLVGIRADDERVRAQVTAGAITAVLAGDDIHQRLVIRMGREVVLDVPSVVAGRSTGALLAAAMVAFRLGIGPEQMRKNLAFADF